jgi:hypothetical protein
MTHSPYEAPEMIPEADFVEAREQLRERRRLIAAVIVVIALVCAGIAGAMIHRIGTPTQQAENRTLDMN